MPYCILVWFICFWLSKKKIKANSFNSFLLKFTNPLKLDVTRKTEYLNTWFTLLFLWVSISVKFIKTYVLISIVDCGVSLTSRSNNNLFIYIVPKKNIYIYKNMRQLWRNSTFSNWKTLAPFPLGGISYFLVLRQSAALSSAAQYASCEINSAGSARFARLERSIHRMAVLRSSYSLIVYYFKKINIKLNTQLNNKQVV